MIESPPSTLIQVQPSSSKLPLILVGPILMLTVGAGGVYLGKYLYGPKTSQPALSGTPTPRAGGLTTTPTSDLTANWKTYSNDLYGFETKYFPESIPTESVGTETDGQFTYLLLVRFGTNPVKSAYGYELRVDKQRYLDSYRQELVGHITDRIDSEEVVEINDISWTKVNYQLFLVADFVPFTLVITTHDGHNYLLTAATLDINDILSTFKFIE